MLLAQWHASWLMCDNYKNMGRILLINNDFDTMHLLKQWLELKGYMVEYTGNYEHIPRLLKIFSPDLFIINSQQRDIAERLHNYAVSMAVPVLMMTGYTSWTNNYIQDDDVMEKPLNLKLLAKKINELIKKECN